MLLVIFFNVSFKYIVWFLVVCCYLLMYYYFRSILVFIELSEIFVENFIFSGRNVAKIKFGLFVRVLL